MEQFGASEKEKTVLVIRKLGRYKPRLICFY